MRFVADKRFVRRSVSVVLMVRRKGIRRVPVTGPQGVLVGLVAMDDLLEVLAEEMQAMAGAISSGRQHESAARP